MSTHLRSIALASTLALLASACGGGGDDDATPDAPSSGADAAAGADATPTADAAPPTDGPTAACALPADLGALGPLTTTTLLEANELALVAAFAVPGTTDAQILVGLISGRPPFGTSEAPEPYAPGTYTLPLAADVTTCGACAFFAATFVGDEPTDGYDPGEAILNVTSTTGNFTGSLEPTVEGGSIELRGFTVGDDESLTPNGCTSRLSSLSFDVVLPAP